MFEANIMQDRPTGRWNEAGYELKDSDCFWASFALISPLFLATYGLSSGSAIFLFVLAAVSVLHYKFIISVFRTNYLLFAFPIYAIFSTIWSIHPSRTLLSGSELIVTTFAAVMIGTMPSRLYALLGIFSAYAIVMVVSAAFGHMTGWGALGAQAFSGIAGGKNAMGSTAAVAMLLAVAVFGLVRKRGGLIPIAGGGAIFLLSSAILFLSHASGALLAFGIGIVALIIPLIFYKLSDNERIWAVVVSVVVFAGIGFSFQTISAAVAEKTMAALNKDTSLTGRVTLWRHADALIEANPALGVGYDAFWTQGDPEPEALWAINHIDNRSGFNFHNTVREVWVGLGVVGLAIFVLIEVGLILALTVRSISYGRLSDALSLGISIFYFSRWPVEALAPAPFQFDVIVMLACLAIPLRDYKSEGAVRKNSSRGYVRRQNSDPTLNRVV